MHCHHPERLRKDNARPLKPLQHAQHLRPQSVTLRRVGACGYKNWNKAKRIFPIMKSCGDKPRQS
eukprot:6205669-Amphidinium_carterae.1